MHNFDVRESSVFQNCVELPVFWLSQETVEICERNVDLDLPMMLAPRKRSSEHTAEHTVDDPVLLVDEKSLDDTLQLPKDVLHEKQVQVDRFVQELKRAKEKLRLVEKSASLVFPCDLERIQDEIQNGHASLAVALRDLHARREQCELWKRRRISRS